MDTFDPRVAEVPPAVSDALKKMLRQSLLRFSRPLHGTTGRTFIVESAGGKHVLRIETGSGLHLRRAVSASQLAAGAGVAVPEILAVCEDSSVELFWYLENFVEGRIFPHDAYGTDEICRATVSLGKNLRRLHSVPLKQFGLLPPNPWLNWESAHERYRDASEKVEQALIFAGLGADVLPNVFSAYEYMMSLPPIAPCLCKADCRTSNILTHEGKISAIIDWEWATGDVGATDIAAWHFANNDPAALDIILSAYEPENELEFRRQVYALIVVGIISEFLVFKEHANFFSKADSYSGLNERKTKLLACLENPGWVK